MNEQPLVSVLMTTYNREKYLAEAIESVLASTYKNFELIIVDDRSKDRTVEIAREYMSKDERIQVYVNVENLGDYPNRNMAASYAKGKYIKYVDADDMIYPHGLEVLVTMMEKFPEAGWGLCSLKQGVSRLFPFQLTPKEAYEYHYFGPGLFVRAPLSSIIKKEVFDSVHGFKPIKMAGDYEMWHRLAQKFPVVLMPQGIIWWRQHDQQEMNSYRDFIKVYERLKINFLLDPLCPLTKEQSQQVIKNTRILLKKQLLKGIIKFNPARIKDNFIKLKEY